MLHGIFRTPWSANNLDNKPKLVDMPDFSAPKVDPVMSIKEHNRKRKRADTLDSIDPLLVDTKRARLDHAIAPVNMSTTPAEATKPEPEVRAKVEAPVGARSSLDMASMQQTIEHHFNLEIMYKHRELRLIEQEMAKCQIALEQLRRCAIIPYPGASGPSPAVSSTTGPAIRPPPPMTRPEFPAPWGVTDGPYTRHYAKWLIPDAGFDSTPVSMTAPPQPDILSARSTARASISIPPVTTRGRRASRESWSGTISLPSSTAPSTLPTPVTTRSRGGPLVIKRMSDNMPVKLVCCRCHRHDFSSVQGFLNHCRIGHKLDYKSHEAAAQQCGQLLGPDEAHLADQMHSAAPPHQPRHSIAAPSQTATTAKKEAVLPPARGIHWLNSATASNRTWKTRTKSAAKVQKPVTAAAPKPTPAAAAFLSEPFKASEAAPRLSAHFAKHNIGGDLHALTVSAKEQHPIDSDGEQDDEDSSFNTSPVKPGAIIERSSSRKGFRQPAAQRGLQLSSFASSRTSNSSRSQSMDNVELSPQTADSNPGLVSDGEDDVASEPEEIAGPAAVKPAQIGLEQTCGQDGQTVEIDVQVDDSTNEHGVILQRRDTMMHDRHG